MEITINLLNENDAEELFEFEIVNRMFFEEMVPSRGVCFTGISRKSTS